MLVAATTNANHNALGATASTTLAAAADRIAAIRATISAIAPPSAISPSRAEKVCIADVVTLQVCPIA